MTIEPLVQTNWDQLQVLIFKDRNEMGRAAANAIAKDIHESYQARSEVVTIFASAPSQSDMLASLRHIKKLPWHAVKAFHVDEYLGLDYHHPTSFAHFLENNIFKYTRPAKVHYLNGTAPPAQEAQRYTELLQQQPLDIGCIGIGENGHLAFNDPSVADFDDPLWVKEVSLEQSSRQQQVNDAMFSTLDAVPRQALTLTLSALQSIKKIHCVVPGSSKAVAVRRTLLEPISTTCPASILRRHAHSTLYLDQNSASLLPLDITPKSEF